MSNHDRNESKDRINEELDVVVLVHGIRDFALWQNSIRSCLEETGFTVESTNYGRFNLIQFLLPFGWFRRAAIETVHRQLRIVAQENPNRNVSVIAHSFGTFIVARLLQDKFDLQFNKVILCGSVLPYDFEFEQIKGRFQSPIMNEVGTRDIWPAIAESVTFGYGSAGTYGFRRPLVRDRWHNGAHHGYFLNREFCEKYWIPLLRDGAMIAGAESPEHPRLWIRLLSIIKLRYITIAAVAAALPVLFAVADNEGWLDKAGPAVVATDVYCEDLKSVLTSAQDRFDEIIGPINGENKQPTVPLEGWEDCIIFMERPDFNDHSRRYSCKISGFPTQRSALRAAKKTAQEIARTCLGGGSSVANATDSNQIPYWRVVRKSMRASVALSSSKYSLSPGWSLQIDIQ